MRILRKYWFFFSCDNGIVCVCMCVPVCFKDSLSLIGKKNLRYLWLKSMMFEKCFKRIREVGMGHR